MNITFEQPKEDQAVIEIELTKKEWDRELENAKNLLNTDDQNVIRQFAAENQANQALSDIIQNEKLKLSTQPVLEVKNEDGDTVISINCELIPPVELGQYKGLGIKKEPLTVDESEVEATLLQQISSKQAWQTMPSDYAAKAGDRVIIDFIGERNGVPFEGGSGQNYPLVLGSNSFIPGFEDQLIGIKANESRDVKVSFPQDYFESSLAGQAVVFHCTCHAVEQLVAPELTDEFIARLEVGAKTVDQLKDRIRTELKALKEQEASGKAMSEVLKKIIETSQVKAPDSLVKNQVSQRIAAMENNLRAYGLGLDQYLQMSGLTLEELEKAETPQAIEDIQASLILEAVAESENIEVSEEEIKSEYELLSRVYNLPDTQLQALIPVGNVTMEILQRKTLEFLEKENITD